jgi:hypothetical protein
MLKQPYLKTLCKCKLLFIALAICATVGPAYAALNEMSNDDLSAVDARAGQTGLLIGLELRLNQNSSAGTDTAGALNCTGANLVYCRVGVQFNQVADWLLFKGINGYIHIPQILLYGANLTDTNVIGSSAPVNQSAIAVNIVFPNSTNGTAIKIRNFGFTLGLQPEINSSGVLSSISAANDQSSYYKYSTYQTDNTQPFYSAYANDTGKETGIIGVKMNGNLNVGGTLYVFAK